jgi:hypothetical protein
VCGGSDHISKVEGRWNDTGCHQPTDVSHICKQDSLVLVGDLQYVRNKILCFLVYATPFIEVLAFWTVHILHLVRQCLQSWIRSSPYAYEHSRNDGHTH